MFNNFSKPAKNLSFTPIPATRKEKIKKNFLFRKETSGFSYKKAITSFTVDSMVYSKGMLVLVGWSQLIILDAVTGNILTNKSFTNIGLNDLVVFENDIYITGHDGTGTTIAVIKVDFNGTVIWYKRLATLFYSYISISDDGRTLYLPGSNSTTSPTRYATSKTIDAITGNLLSGNTTAYPSSVAAYPVGFLLTETGKSTKALGFVYTAVAGLETNEIYIDNTSGYGRGSLQPLSGLILEDTPYITGQINSKNYLCKYGNMPINVKVEGIYILYLVGHDHIGNIFAISYNTSLRSDVTLYKFDRYLKLIFAKNIVSENKDDSIRFQMSAWCKSYYRIYISFKNNPNILITSCDLMGCDIQSPGSLIWSDITSRVVLSYNDSVVRTTPGTITATSTTATISSPTATTTNSLIMYKE